VLSLCSGDGRDLLPELAARPDRDVAATLVELDGGLAAAARARAAGLGLAQVDVRRGDAGATATFASALPVDLLVLCGIFGNIAPEDIRRTIAAVPTMLAPGGIVVWTRGVVDAVDLRPDVRAWLGAAGLVELAFDGAPELYGVGVARAGAGVGAGRLPARLFTFVR
jgi:hypothetical protein